MHSVWHGKGLVDMTAAVPLNSTDTHHSAMKLCSNCTVFSNTRMMSEKVMDEGRGKSKFCYIPGLLVHRIYFAPLCSFKDAYLNFPCVGMHGAVC